MNFDVPEFVSLNNSKGAEYDRFIPQRQPDCGLGSNFENKDHIFSEKSLSCHHTAYEMGCSNFSTASIAIITTSRNNVVNGKTGEQAAPDTDQNNQIFQTLLCSQLLGAPNPHILNNGALNDQTEIDDEFIHSSRLLTTQYNALDFRQKRPDEERMDTMAPSPI